MVISPMQPARRSTRRTKPEIPDQPTSSRLSRVRSTRRSGSWKLMRRTRLEVRRNWRIPASIMELTPCQGASAEMVNVARDWIPSGGIALVFGSGGAIGSALVGRLRQDRAFERVLAFSRSSTPAIDLMTEESLSDAASFAASRGDIRLVVDSTGFLHSETQRPEKSWRELAPAQMARSFALNAIGPALIMKHVLPLLPRKVSRELQLNR
jgi:hypothetical protein